MLENAGFGGGCHWCTEAVFQSLRGVTEVAQGFIAADPPVHTAQRKVIAPAFNPSQMAEREKTVRQRTRELFDALPVGETFTGVRVRSGRYWRRTLTTFQTSPVHQAAMPWFAELNRSLNDELDTEGFVARIRASHTQLQRLAAEILQRALSEHPGLKTDELAPLLPAQAAEDELSDLACMLPETVC